eukprot:1121198-Amphidinium_carterae.1
MTKELDLDKIAKDDGDERRVNILVKETVPPFLDGRVQYTEQMDPVCPVKEPAKNEDKCHLDIIVTSHRF